jgi:hypothetical protein
LARRVNRILQETLAGEHAEVGGFEWHGW